MAAKNTKSASTRRTNKVNSFASRKVEDHKIVDSNGQVVGHVRVKPSSILWSPKNGRDWYGIPLSKFGDYLVVNGRKQKK
jgi:hypothetical protein